LTSADGLVIQDVVPSTSDITSVAHAQDVPALKLVHPAVLAVLLQENRWALARFLLPWSCLEMAIRAAGLSQADRMTCHEMAFEARP
jgi:hypothetical protein